MNHKNQNIMKHKAMLRASVCLFMLSGSCVLYAQNNVGVTQTKQMLSNDKKNAPTEALKEVSGRVYDGATGRPISGVTVQALNNRYYSTTTDADGRYKFKVPKSVNVLFVDITGSCVLYDQKNIMQVVTRTGNSTSMKQVSGRVFDAATGDPMPGVTVQVLNNSKYTALTDENGDYTLMMPAKDGALFVNVDGYNPIQLAVKGPKDQNAKLQSGIIKSRYADGTDLLDGKSVTLDNTSALTVEEELGTHLNGQIYTINRSGLPAQGEMMLINGIHSLNANVQPLVIIDGVMQDMQYNRSALHDGFINNIFNIIDPEDIENVEVVQNGLALYGARGANGVLKISTRRGKSMVTRIKARVYGGIETIPSKMQMMDGEQFRNYASEFIGTIHNGAQWANVMPFLNEDPSFIFYPMYHNNENWQKDLYHTAMTQNYKIAVEGGDDVAKYNLSLGYSQSEATQKHNDFDRLNIRFNTDVYMFRGMTTAIDLSYGRNAYNILDNGWASNYDRRNISSPNVLGMIQSPFVSKYTYFVKYVDDALQLNLTDLIYSGKNFDSNNNPLNYAKGLGFSGFVNPYWILQNGHGSNKNYQEQTQFALNIAPKYRINKHLFVEDRFSYILNRSNEKYYLPKNGTPSKEVEGLGSVSSVVRSQFSKETTLYNDLHLNWERHMGSHHVNLTGGFRATSYNFSDSHIAGYNNDNDKMPNLSYSLQYKTYGGATDTWTNLSYYLDANYDFGNRYFARFIMSADASSRFGKETDQGLKAFGVKWGLFPSMQVGWVMSNESWFKLPAVNYLRLTAGVDVSGNDDVNYYATRTYFSNQKFLDKATSLELANIENPSIQWETTTKYNLGLRTNLFNNRVALGLNYFYAKTNHLLTLNNVSDITGLQTMWSNEGALSNNGVNFDVDLVLVNHKDWRWTMGANLGHYHNKMTSLPKSELNTITAYALTEEGRADKSQPVVQMTGKISSIFGKENIITAVGQSAGVFYGYQTKGVFATDVEAKEAGKYGYLRYPTGIFDHPYRNFQAGDVHFVDQNGDGWISEADRVKIGNPNPKIYGNFYTSIGWKHLSLGAYFKYSVGNDIYNYQRSQLESASNIYNQTTAVVNRWRMDGQQTDMPRVMSPENEQWVNNERFSDRWIEDGSYLKLKKVRLTYKVPLNLSWLQGLAVWGEANDVFTVTKYLGKDPEVVAGNGVLYQGIDAGHLPTGHSYNFGITLNL